MQAKKNLIETEREKFLIIFFNNLIIIKFFNTDRNVNKGKNCHVL